MSTHLRRTSRARFDDFSLMFGNGQERGEITPPDPGASGPAHQTVSKVAEPLVTLLALAIKCSRSITADEIRSLRARRVEVTRVTLLVEEEPAMAKRLKKKEKLDLILSELAKLRGEVKKLVRERAATADRRVKGKAPQRTATEKKPVSDAAKPKPVLLPGSQTPQPVSRTASQ